MKRSVCLLLTLVVLLIMSSCDRDQRKAKNWNDKTLADLDAIKFIRGGITGGLMEIKAANLAKTRSSNPRVINFANMMIADHTQIGKELKEMESDKMLDKDKNINNADIISSGRVHVRVMATNEALMMARLITRTLTSDI